MAQSRNKRTYTYRSTEYGILIPVEMVQNDREVQLIAVLDTGSEYCLFDRRLGESMEIDIDSGIPLRLRA